MFSARNITPVARAGTRAFSSTQAQSAARLSVIGRLAEAPRVHTTGSGREITRFSLAVESGARGEDGNRHLSFFPISCFKEGAVRDFLTSLPKGTLMHVEADARMETYLNPESNKQSRLSLVQRHFEALSRPSSSSNGSGGESAAESPDSGIGQS